MQRFTEKKTAKVLITVLVLLAAFFACLLFSDRAMGEEEKESATLKGKIFIEDICVDGMTEEQIQTAIAQKMEEYSSDPVTIYANDGVVETTAGALGLSYANTSLASDIMKLRDKGNIWQRFQIETYVNRPEGLYFELDLTADADAVRTIVENECVPYDIDRADSAIAKGDDGTFYNTETIDGRYVNVDATTESICAYLNDDWHGGIGAINASIDVDEAVEHQYDASLMNSIIGSGTTDYSASGANRAQNIENGVSKINASFVLPGEEFSVLDKLVPFTEEEGWTPAGTYEEGEVIDELGGGICQVSSTLYRAVLEAELEVTERSEHSMVVSYVEPSMDAAVSEGSKDFKFINDTDSPIYIEGYCSDGKVFFNIYGHETREAGRSIAFESVVESETEFKTTVTLDPNQPFGYVQAEDGHKGQVAHAEKIVYQDGTEVSREKINSSVYHVSDNTAVVGTAGAPEEFVKLLEHAAKTKKPEEINPVLVSYGLPAIPQAEYKEDVTEQDKDKTDEENADEENADEENTDAENTGEAAQ